MSTVHVVDFRQSDAAGMIGILLVHDDESWDWNECGVTAFDVPCVAVNAVANEGQPCRKQAVVEMVARAMYARQANHQITVCGGHFNVHRSGKELRVRVTPGRRQ